MNSNEEYDIETWAHDIYEYEVYEDLRRKFPRLSAEELAEGVAQIIGWDTTDWEAKA